ncbi:unnamed protein product [Knipowitschia caucasica]
MVKPLPGFTVKAVQSASCGLERVAAVRLDTASSVAAAGCCRRAICGSGEGALRNAFFSGLSELLSLG